MTRRLELYAALGLSLAACVAAAAQNADRPRGANPPQAALDACAAARPDDACSFEAPFGRIDGVCRRPPQGASSLACAPEGGPPNRDGARRRFRHHTVEQSDGAPELLEATEPPIAQSRFETRIEGDWRIIVANAVAEHDTGPFPNPGNPNAISEQHIEVRVPAHPVLAADARPVAIGEFGYALNGVPFDPGAAEFYHGDPTSGWQYEALSGAIGLGMDENHAHVQPTGKYHYHGLPTLFLEDVDLAPDAHSPLVGWAMDGFPIYARYGHADPFDANSPIVELTSSYQLKPGDRPGGPDAPGGRYDGTFTADYAFVEGAGDLDACNGRMMVTPEFPDGTYAYVLTQTWPVAPRCLRGQSDAGYRLPAD